MPTTMAEADIRQAIRNVDRDASERRLARSIVWDHSRSDVPDRARQVDPAEENQHQADGQLGRESNARRNHPSKHDDARAHQQNGERVTNAPRCADCRRGARRPLARDNRRHGHDVISVGGVAHSENQTERHDWCETGRIGHCRSFLAE
jgi:hypothetical protein